MRLEAIVEAICAALPDVIAVYVFGSVARGDAVGDSDLDVAILPVRPLDVLRRFDLQQALASVAGRDVDLVDLRRASAVMRVQVLADGRTLYEGDRGARALFEATALSDYARLNEERRGILADVRRRGTVHG